MQESNFSCHCLGACFKPYRDLVNLHTLLSCPDSTKPLVDPYKSLPLGPHLEMQFLHPFDEFSNKKLHNNN